MKNRTKILTAIAFLFSVSSMFSNELANLIKPNFGQGNSESKIRLTRHTVFVRKNVTNAAGGYNIIDENTKKIDGVSSLADTKLPKNQAVIFDKISLGFAEANATGKEGALDYGVTAVPAILRNAQLVITQNGREVLDIPVADIVKGQQSNNAADLYHDLEGFNYLVDDQPMEWVLRFPNGQTLAPSAAGMHNYLELRIQGFKTSRKQA